MTPVDTSGALPAARAEDVQAPSLGRRNERLLIAGVIGYSLVIVLLMVLRGVEITPDVMAVAFGLGAILLGRGRLFLRDWLPFLALFLAYELMRGLADNVGFPVHVVDMVTAERLVSFGQVPTQVLQSLLHPAHGVDLIAEVATVVYMLHFALPLVTGFILWVWRRNHYYDFVAALIVLSLSAFVTFVIMPTAPPWYVAQVGLLNGPDGHAAISYLKPGAFDTLANAFGFKADYIYTYTFYDVNPNGFAAWPSLHVGYPFLSFLVLRRAFGKIGWIGFAYTLLVAFSVMYTGDHWLIDAIGGMAFAYIAFYAIVHATAIQSWLARLRDDSIASGSWQGVGAYLTGLRTGVSWPLVVIGAVATYGGWNWVGEAQRAGETTDWVYLVPWAVLFGGLFLLAAGALRKSRPRAPTRAGSGGKAVGWLGRVASRQSPEETATDR